MFLLIEFDTSHHLHFVKVGLQSQINYQSKSDSYRILGFVIIIIMTDVPF